MKATLEHPLTAEDVTHIKSQLQNLATLESQVILNKMSTTIIEIGPCKLIGEDGMLKIVCEF